MNIYIGETMSVIGDKLFLAVRGGVVVIGPGYQRFIKNSWYDEEHPTKRRKK